ncbi:hypothetical protein TNCV_3902981 [Trichonephila clavipes]|nr:hypothetical protein TNCV_3902981 [Trichonephila clavipes]
MARKRAENRERSLEFPGFVKPVFTKDSKHLGKRKRSLGHLGSVKTRTHLKKVLDESISFFRVHTGYFSNIPKCIKAEFIASWACSQSSVVSSSQR